MDIVIGEDSALLREGLARLLRSEGHSVIAVGNAIEVRHQVSVRRPDLVIVDVRMPPTHTTEGIEAAHELKLADPDLGVLVLSQYVERRYTRELLTGGMGGIGYLLKDRVANVEGFLSDITRIAGGGTAFDPELVHQLLSDDRAERHPIHALTAREADVLAAIAQGLTNTAIGTRLSLSTSAVEKHANAIFTKLGLPRDADTSRRVRAVLEYLEHSD